MHHLARKVWKQLVFSEQSRSLSGPDKVSCSPSYPPLVGCKGLHYRPSLAHSLFRLGLVRVLLLGCGLARALPGCGLCSVEW